MWNKSISDLSIEELFRPINELTKEFALREAGEIDLSVELQSMNEVWFEWTNGQNMPVRACVEARLASPDLLVEIQVTATK